MTASADQLALLSKLPVGARVYALNDTAICAAQEPGIVYQTYSEKGVDAGRAIIFEQGGFDGFSAQELERFILPEGSVDQKNESYTFQSALQLQRDHSRGVFSFKFPRPFPQLEAEIIEQESEHGKKVSSPRV